jgi:hypothetical protein
MSRISLGNFERIEIYEARRLPRVFGVQLVHGLGIATVLAVAVVATVTSDLQIAGLYRLQSTTALEEHTQNSSPF